MDKLLPRIATPAFTLLQVEKILRFPVHDDDTIGIF
jgi:hypothetical protein